MYILFQQLDCKIFEGTVGLLVKLSTERSHGSHYPGISLNGYHEPRGPQKCKLPVKIKGCLFLCLIDEGGCFMETEVSKNPEGLMYKRGPSFSYSLPQRLRENEAGALAGPGPMCPSPIMFLYPGIEDLW